MKAYVIILLFVSPNSNVPRQRLGKHLLRLHIITYSGGGGATNNNAFWIR
jgi:hypothetical protein